MRELLFLFPILLVIALVLGGCRAVTLDRIVREASRSFVKLVAGILILCVGLQALLAIVPLFR